MTDNYERGVQAGIDAFIKYFQDENENSILTDFDSRVLEATAKYAGADALRERRLWVDN